MCHLGFLNPKMLNFQKLPKKSFSIYGSLVKSLLVRLLACEQSLRSYIYAVYEEKIMVETILKCTFCLSRMRVTVCGFFRFLNQTLCIDSLYTVGAKPVSQRTTDTHTQAPKGAFEVL